MAEYCAKFIPNFASKVYNIHSLLKKNVKFEWSTECDDEFAMIKLDLENVNALSSFDPNAECFLTTDASDKGLGAVLSQRSKDGHESIILFASRALSPTESKYPIIESEALACAWALEHLRAFVWGKPVTIHTDHRPLVKLLTTEGSVGASARLARISMRMKEYVYKIVYVLGKQIVIADCLSRLPLRLEECVDDPWGNFSIAFIHDSGLPAFTKTEWMEELHKDKVLQEVAEHICKGWPNKGTIISDIKSFWEIRKELSLDKDLIVRGYKVIPPTSLRGRVLQLCHEGHFGVIRTKLVVKGIFWQPGVDKEIERFVRQCPVCCAADKSFKTLRPPTSEGLIPNIPWEIIAIDIFGPVGDSREYGLVALDLFSKWPIVKIVEKVDTTTVIDFLDKIFMFEELPDSILSDNGVQFTSKCAKDYFEKCGIKHKTTSLYNPSGTGAVERFNRVLKGAMHSGRDWKLEVQKAVWAYRTTTHTTTGLSLFIMMRGRKPRCKFNPNWLLEGKVEQWSPMEVKHNLETMHEKSKVHYDTLHGVKDVHINVGDWVRIKKQTRVPKGQDQFETTQQVTEVLRNAVRLKDGRVWNLKCVALDFKQQPDVSVPSVRNVSDFDWVEDYFNNTYSQQEVVTDRTCASESSDNAQGDTATTNVFTSSQDAVSPLRREEGLGVPHIYGAKEHASGGADSCVNKNIEPCVFAVPGTSEPADLGEIPPEDGKRRRVLPGWLKEYVM